MEISRIRQLRSAAPEYFAPVPSAMNPSAAGGVEAYHRAAAAEQAMHEGDDSARRRAAREALIDSRRNSVDVELRRRRATASKSPARRTSTPPAARRPASPGVTLRQLKGEIPNLEHALLNGTRHRYAATTSPGIGRPRVTPTGDTAGTAASRQQHLSAVLQQARETFRETAAPPRTASLRSNSDAAVMLSAAAPQGATAGDMAATAGASPEAAAQQGVEHLYSRMRQAYVEFRQHPELFMPPTSTPGAAKASPGRPHQATRATLTPFTMPLIPHEPSAESARLRAELDKLEQQWMRLAKLQSSGLSDGRSAAGGLSDGAGGSGFPSWGDKSLQPTGDKQQRRAAMEASI